MTKFEASGGRRGRRSEGEKAMTGAERMQRVRSRELNDALATAGLLVDALEALWRLDPDAVVRVTRPLPGGIDRGIWALGRLRRLSPDSVIAQHLASVLRQAHERAATQNQDEPAADAFAFIPGAGAGAGSPTLSEVVPTLRSGVYGGGVAILTCGNPKKPRRR